MKYKQIFRDYWLKHYLDEKTGLCSLCGNTGIIDTTDSAVSPRGKKGMGKKNFCICPNGRTINKNDN